MFHQTVVVKLVSGKVLIKLKGKKVFVPLGAAQGIPLGSEVDARKGRVSLTSVPKAGGVPETALFVTRCVPVPSPRNPATAWLKPFRS